MNLRFITAENFSGFLDRIRHSDFCIEIFFLEVLLTLCNSEPFILLFLVSLVKKKNKTLQQHIFIHNAHAGKCSSYFKHVELDLSLPYPLTDKLAPSN